MKYLTNSVVHRKITALILTAGLFAMLTGCPQQSTLAALVTTLGNAAASVASVEGNATLATKLQTDTAAASTAVLNWKSGTPATEAIEAINIVEDDLQLFPLTGPYVPLIDLALGTAESIIEILNPTATTPSTAHAQRRVVKLTFTPKNKKDFEKQWNAIAPPAVKIK